MVHLEGSEDSNPENIKNSEGRGANATDEIARVFLANEGTHEPDLQYITRNHFPHNDSQFGIDHASHQGTPEDNRRALSIEEGHAATVRDSENYDQGPQQGYYENMRKKSDEPVDSKLARLYKKLKSMR